MYFYSRDDLLFCSSLRRAAAGGSSVAIFPVYAHDTKRSEWSAVHAGCRGRVARDKAKGSSLVNVLPSERHRVSREPEGHGKPSHGAANISGGTHGGARGRNRLGLYPPEVSAVRFLCLLLRSLAE